MSYQLERNMIDRISQYHDEAAVSRVVPRRDIRRNIAAALRKMADRLEAPAIGLHLSAEQANGIPLHQGRHHR